MVDPRTELIDLLALKAYKEGKFQLSSGAWSDFYIDCKQVSYDPRGAELIGQAVWGIVRAENVVGVGGLTLGADAVVVSTTLAAHREGFVLPGFIVRKKAKEHGLHKMVEGVVPPSGARVAIVDDVVTSGGSALDAIREATAPEVGLKIAIVVPIVDREQGAREAIEARGLRFQPLCTISEIRDAYRRAHTPAFA